MALRELGSIFGFASRSGTRPAIRCANLPIRRYASTDATQDLEPASSFSAPPPSEDIVKSYDPVAQSRRRGRRLPPSRYQFRPPKYYRGPLHPHQPPPPSDPSSRVFQPGPFSLPRLEQTYQSTIQPDLMTLAYTHFPPGYTAPPKGARLRSWEGASPYFKNRPLRGPGAAMNVPKLTGVTVHSMVKEANEDPAVLDVAKMVVQAITNARTKVHKARKSVIQWGHREGRVVSVTADLMGEDMYHFLGKTIDVVLPRIKDWKGVKGSSGDSSGNLTFGLSAESVASFPEIEVNYDMYPPKMIPGCHVTVHTSATNDRDARLLLSSIGIPFYGKLVD
ncbi:54S ribosomal protein L7, mitochondrial [Coniosporium tulheliwenetii]|uniref:54S ribosomal protein L7, mitochondrial n=1 Tax=Coniosporium tulheliwenetii TaxID=3383036 RepID=A0ACC2Z5X0_9PEZI|nr:54S ribosomal protein L7, mitochondrial [Cladosporium sp. JES 115]